MIDQKRSAAETKSSPAETKDSLSSNQRGDPLRHIEPGEEADAIGWRNTEIARLRAEVERLRAALTEAQGSINGWMARATEAEGILKHNLALANRTTRRFQAERDSIIRELRTKYSAAEIADMVGLTRQRVHQILNEAPVEPHRPADVASPRPSTECPKCGRSVIDDGQGKFQPHKMGCPLAGTLTDETPAAPEVKP